MDALPVSDPWPANAVTPPPPSVERHAPASPPERRPTATNDDTAASVWRESLMSTPPAGSGERDLPGSLSCGWASMPLDREYLETV